MALTNDVAPVPYKTPIMDKNGVLSPLWLAWFRQLMVRIGGNDASILLNPMTGLGDLIYGGSSGAPLALPADTSNVRKFLRALSVNGVATPPVWDVLQAGDIPALSYLTSVAMTVPSILSVSGSPVTSSGTLALSLVAQVANAIFAGPTSGGSGTPTFRGLVAADIPALAYVTSVAMTVPSIFSLSGSPITSSGTLGLTLANQSANQVFAGPSSGGAAAPSFRSHVYADISPALKSPTVTRLTSTGTTAGYLFTISTSTTCAVGDTYTNNGNTYTVLVALSAQSGQVLYMSGASAPTASGTLTRSSGAGTASITFSANTPLASYTTPSSPTPAYLRVRLVGGGGGGGGGGTNNGTVGGTGGITSFVNGAVLIAANGGVGSNIVPGAGGTVSSSGVTLVSSNQGSSGYWGTPNINGATSTFPFGGSGASTFFGAGGIGAGQNNSPSGGVGNGFGSGGGGGSTTVATAGAYGGAGGGAGGFADVIISAPGSSYYYAIGSGGAAGAAGASGTVGFAGAGGLIVVEECFQ